MPAAKVKETPLERAARLQKVAAGISVKADRSLCIEILRKRDDIVPHVKGLMVSMGAIDAAGKATAGPANLTARSSGADKDDDNMQAKVVAPRTMEEVRPQHELHRNYSTWGGVPVIYVCWLLSRIEPVTFSIANMKGSTSKRNGKLPSQESVLQWFEVTTGMDADQSVGETRVLGDLVKLLSEASCKLGRRSRDLSLPVDWATQGIYCVTADKNGNAVLVNRWTSQSAEFEGIRVDADGSIPHSIDMNWSEHRAVVNFVGKNRMSKLCISVLGLSLGHPLVALGVQGKRKRGSGSESEASRLQALTNGPNPSPTKICRLLELKDAGAKSAAASDEVDSQSPANPPSESHASAASEDTRSTETSANVPGPGSDGASGKGGKHIVRGGAGASSRSPAASVRASGAQPEAADKATSDMASAMASAQPDVSEASFVPPPPPAE